MARAVSRLAQSEGVTPTPLANAWLLKLRESVPYHRGRNRGLSVAVAISGRKIVTYRKKTAS
ncbi:hypothetical protein QW131_02885 [Roseibium salinum]|nr:hypothetical protein [Roseibium salinum]